MRTVRQIPDRQQEAFHVGPHWTIRDAAQYMSERYIGAVAVVNEKMEVIGILSERGILRDIVAQGRDPEQVRVQDIMTRHVVTVGPDECLDKCLKKMNQRRIRHLPVVDDTGKLLGMVSMRDIMELLLQDREGELQALMSYVHQVPPGFPLS